MPYPPSVNGYWKPFKNRIILSKRGREYRINAVESLKNQGLQGELIKCNVSLLIELYPPSLRRFDADNYCKGIMDALTHADFWVDDEQVYILTVKKMNKVAGGRVDIVVNQLTDLN
jgi:crossover junction endodeoxyribonuclease RusA